MLYNVYTTLLAVVSVPILYWTGILVKKIIYIARCRHRAAKLPGMPLLPVIGNLHQVKENGQYKSMLYVLYMDAFRKLLFLNESHSLINIMVDFFVSIHSDRPCH